MLRGGNRAVANYSELNPTLLYKGIAQILYIVAVIISHQPQY